MDCELWFRRAKGYIETRVEPNKAFEVRDLFESYVWNQLSKGERITFGKFFANAVAEKQVDSIVRIDRAKNNHARYIKQE